MNDTFSNLYTQIYQGTAAVVRATQPFNPGTNFTVQRQRIDASLAGTVSKVPGVRAVVPDIEGYAQLVGKTGKPIGVASNGPPTIGVAWTDVTALNPLRLLSGGQPPHAAGQVVIDRHSADVGHFTVGDKVRILTQESPGVYTITGIATWGGADSPLGATISAFDPATAARIFGQPGKVNQLDVQAAPGISQDTLVTRIRDAIHNPGIEVVSGQSVTSEGQQTIHQALSFIGIFLLTFGFIALFGLAASAAGVGAGIGLAVALKAGLSALGLDLPASGLVVSSRTVAVGLLAGTAVTVMSALSPARRASRIPPAAALQDMAAEPRRPLVRRTAADAVLTAIGLAVLGIGLFAHLGNRMPVIGAGAVALFTGISALGPFIAGSLCRLIGAPLARCSTVGKLGRENAIRNPARTAATAAALMIGVTLVSAITVMASSMKGAVNSVIDSAMRADFVVSSGAMVGSGSGFSPAVERSLAALPQVSDVTGIRSGVVKVFGGVTPVVTADPAKAAPLFNIGVTSGDLEAMTPAGRELAGDYVLPLTAARANFPQALDLAVYVKLGPGVSTSAARPAIDRALAAYPNITLQDQAQYKTSQAQQVNQLLNLIYGLLALAVGIALIGIANTLILVVPVPQLLTLTVLAGLAGVVASIGPSRRAARLSILRAVTTE